MICIRKHRRIAYEAARGNAFPSSTHGWRSKAGLRALAITRHLLPRFRQAAHVLAPAYARRHDQHILIDAGFVGSLPLPLSRPAVLAGSLDLSQVFIGREISRQSISPRISHTSGAADAIASAAIGVANGELVVGIRVEANIGVHLHAYASAQLQAVGLLQYRH